MKFQPGYSGNKNGRPVGSKNKANGQLRQLISDFLEQNFDQVMEDFAALEAKDRVKFYLDLLQYGVPKLQSVSSSINWEDLTDEQLDEIINRLKGEV